MFTKKMGLYCSFLVGSLVYFSTSHAQENPSEVFPKKGDWALQFAVGNNFTLTSFQGSTISLKRQLSDRSAFRFGVSSSASSISGTHHDSRTDISPWGSIARDDKSTGTSGNVGIEVVGQWIQIKPIEERLVFYYGAGPLLRYSRYHTKNHETYGDIPPSYQVREYKTTSDRWGIGGNAVCGVEWFVRKRISLSAEYGVGLVYIKNDGTSNQYNYYVYSNNTTQVQEYNAKEKSDGFSFSSNPVRFGLAVYF